MKKDRQRLCDDPLLEPDEAARLVFRFADVAVQSPSFRAIDLNFLRAMLFLLPSDGRIQPKVLSWLRCEDMARYDRDMLGGLVPRPHADGLFAAQVDLRTETMKTMKKRLEISTSLRRPIMLPRCLTFGVFTLLLIGGGARADDWKPDPGFRSLFNGRDLTGWCFRAKSDRKSPRVGDVTEKFDGKSQSSDNGRYSAKDGILTVNFPKGKDRLIAQLYTVEEFPKDLVLRLEFRASPNADSGIFIRKPQLQCRDYLVAGPYKDLKKYKAQDWNQVEVVVVGGKAKCTCNGEVLEAEFAVPPTGPIGLEGDRGQMEYRHIQIKTP